MTPLASWVCSGGEQPVPDADPGGDDHTLAVDEDVEVLMDVESQSSPRRNTDRIEPRA